MSRWALLAVMIFIGAPELWAETLYYRYPGPNDTVVISSSVPPEAVPLGYEVIRVDGSVVKSVAPKLSEAEDKTQALALELAAARAVMDEKNSKWDESLLLRYSSMQDIDVAQGRAINDIKVRISILKSNLSVIKQQILTNQLAAAELERRGQEVSSALMNTLTSLRREITTTEQHIKGRVQDLDEVTGSYERDKARFTHLQSQAENRLPHYSADD